MAVNVSVDCARNDLSQLEYTYDLISSLSDDELEAVQKIAIAFLTKNFIFLLLINSILFLP